MSDSTVTTAPATRPRRRGFLFPLILIALGLAFLAANFGYLPPISARALVSLWPVLLILAGIEMLVARRDPYVALGLEVLVIALALGVVITQPRGLFVSPPSGSGSSSATVARENARSLSLRFEGGAGDYTLRGGATALVEAASTGGEISVRTDRRSGDVAEVRVQPSGFGGDIVLFGGVPPVNVDVKVASDVPTSLRVTGGAGDFSLDLRDIQVKDARIETGASKVELTLPKPSGDVPVRIEAGAATVTISVPDDAEASVTTSGGLITTNFDNVRFGGGTSASFARGGSTRTTPGYAAAKDRLTITITAGASSITIR
jgi:hypothetical protein